MTDLIAIVTHEFSRHRSLAERAVAPLSDEQFFARPAPAVNPIALIIKHLAGNLRARWSDPLGGDGEPPTRNRDGEFVLDPTDSRAALMAAWDGGWSTLEATIGRLRPEDLDRTITIRGEAHTMAQALLRAATHAAYHVGQILYVARMLEPEAPYLTMAPRAARDASPEPSGGNEVRPYLVAAPHRGHGDEVPHVQRVLETALYVDDVPRAVEFYTSVLGLRRMAQEARIASIDGGCATVLLLFRRGASLAGVPTDGGEIPPHDGSGPAHAAFAIAGADFDRWRGHLERHGVKVESVVTWPRGGRSMYFRDPDGHSVELATPGVWEVY